MSYSKTILLGNLGGDPKVKRFDDGGVRVDFNLATQDGYKNSEGQWVKVTDWHLCYCTGKRAETLAKYLKKGMQVHVEGRNKTRKYTDANGVQKYVTEVKVLDFSFTGTKEKATQEQSSDAGVNDNEPDDLPF